MNAATITGIITAVILAMWQGYTTFYVAKRKQQMDDIQTQQTVTAGHVENHAAVIGELVQKTAENTQKLASPAVAQPEAIAARCAKKKRK